MDSFLGIGIAEKERRKEEERLASEATMARLNRRCPDFLRDLGAQDRLHEAERRPGSLTVVFHWDDNGKLARVTAQTSPEHYDLTGGLPDPTRR